MAKVKAIIEHLQTCNPDAELQIVLNSYPVKYSFGYGGSEGSTKENCDWVSLHVGDSQENETRGS